MDATVTAAAAVTVITAVTTSVMTILTFVSNRKAVLEAKQAVVAAKVSVGEAKVVAQEITRQGEAQFDQITTVMGLVDGQLTRVLQELADSRAEKAARTGTPADRKLADDAQSRADAQSAKVDAAGIGAKTAKLE